MIFPDYDALTPHLSLPPFHGKTDSRVMTFSALFDPLIASSGIE